MVNTGILIYTGTTLNLSTLTLGLHNLHVVVSFPNGCSSTSNVYNLFVEDCCCEGSTWGNISMTTVSGVLVSGASEVKKDLKCNNSYTLKCNETVNINAAYNCAQQNCSSNVTYILTGPNVTSSGNVPFNFTPTQSGAYTLTLNGWCGTVKCDSCVITFKVDCPPVDDCCPYNITAQAGNVTYTVNSSGTATIANQTFSISGLAGVPLTEVRAEVISYDLSSNFNNECLPCKTFPFTWASINSATNIGTVTPKITLFGGTTTVLFNPTAPQECIKTQEK